MIHTNTYIECITSSRKSLQDHKPEDTDNGNKKETQETNNKIWWKVNVNNTGKEQKKENTECPPISNITLSAISPYDYLTTRYLCLDARKMS